MPHSPPEFLYKILSPADWGASQRSDRLSLGPDDTNFIHLAEVDQVRRIARKFFSECPELVVVRLRSRELPGKLVKEANPGGTRRYFHLYEGHLPLSAVESHKIILQDNVNSLKKRYSQARSVSFDVGPGDFVRVTLRNSSGCCKVSLYGGHILTAGLKRGGELFWLSTEAVYREGKAIRGGVPIVFPWFGDHFQDPNLPAHGFARLSTWELREVHEGEDGAKTTLVLGLKDNEETRVLWPHTFDIRQEISLSPEGIQQSLKVTNTDASSWSFAGGFHPYFRIGGLSSTTVSGLEGRPYINLVDASEHRGREAIGFGNEVDRAYHCDGEDLEIRDRGGHKVISVECDGCDSVVVWNPGLGKPKSDMPKSGPEEFVCVEPALGATARTSKDYCLLKPGESRSLSYWASIVPLELRKD